MRRAMIDLETAGKRPGCVILSIGVVMFTEEGLCSVNDQPVTFEAFPDVIQQQEMGQSLDMDTFLWWLTQPKEAQDALSLRVNPTCGTRNVMAELGRLAHFLSFNAAEEIWCVGQDFDLPILAALYRASGHGAFVPWKYNAGRDVRTFMASLGKKCGDFGSPNVLKHDALADAKFQALEVAAALQYRAREAGALVAMNESSQAMKVAAQ